MQPSPDTCTNSGAGQPGAGPGPTGTRTCAGASSGGAVAGSAVDPVDPGSPDRAGACEAGGGNRNTHGTQSSRSPGLGILADDSSAAVAPAAAGRMPAGAPRMSVGSAGDRVGDG
ncbi:hypothetical protein [Mycobacterium riyadhense]|uniref:hypothetical protein n=1 Tax=Mycobacterium riyadhense TaxID=486698 RepID=UPI0023BB1879|nr:hypothetical protein [Mycobacterium riyadhense]